MQRVNSVVLYYSKINIWKYIVVTWHQHDPIKYFCWIPTCSLKLCLLQSQHKRQPKSWSWALTGGKEAERKKNKTERIWAYTSLLQTCQWHCQLEKAHTLLSHPHLPISLSPLPVLLPLPKGGSADRYILESFRGFLAASKSPSGPWPQPDEQGCSELLPQQPEMLHEILANTYKQGGILNIKKKYVRK